MSEPPQDQARLDALVRAALDRPTAERLRWIDDVCGSDAGLRRTLYARVSGLEQETEHWSPGTTPAPGSGPGRGSSGRGSSGRSGSSGRASYPNAEDAPLLAPGQQIGRYEIVELLGAGGMGRVYRAMDRSLGREVAIKALAQAFRGDSGSLRRFEREARVLAALSHPNIAAIYGLERLDGAPYLVLERVDGETLAQRLTRGSLEVDEAIAIGLQVVEGLEEAHAKGVVHRDLKPSNVMLAVGDRAKLVDFGLAKPAGLAAEENPEVTSEPITVAGAVLGTARYMSPEQVRGEDVDTRTDVWAFGCLLYEMLTGRAVFAGRSIAEVLAAVLRDEPDWRALPANTPPGLVRLIRRCLRRDAHTRLQHIGDARIELLDVKSEPLPAPAVSGRTPWVPWVVVAAAATAAALIAAWLVLRPRADRPPAQPVRLSLDLPTRVRLSDGFAPPFDLTPAGDRLVIEAVDGDVRRLYSRRLDNLQLTPLAGTDMARQPFFSPDGRSVGFFADRRLARVPTDGGPVQPLAEVGGNPRGAAWGPDGTIILSPSQTSGLERVSDRGGPPTVLTRLDRARGEYSHRWPDVLPGGRWTLFTVGFEDESFDEARIEAVNLQTGERRRVQNDAGFGRYLPGGRLLFIRGGRLHSVGFDPETLTVSGSHDVLVDGIRYEPQNGAAHLAVSETGIVMYGSGAATSPDRFLTWVDQQGVLKRLVDSARPYRDLRLSPDGHRVAMTIGTSRESDLWVVEANGTLSQLSFGLSPMRPVWTADGSRITVTARKDAGWQLVTIGANGGAPQFVIDSPHRLYANAWSRDGRVLVYQVNDPQTGWDLMRLEVDAEGRPQGPPQVLAATPAQEMRATFSPDGHWLAYESDELDGVVQIYARSFPAAAHKIRLSTGGARMPVWKSASTLHFWHTGRLELHRVHTRVDAGQLVVVREEPVWPATPDRLVITSTAGRYDVHTDGRILAQESSAATLQPAFARPVIALDWLRPR